MPEDPSPTKPSEVSKKVSKKVSKTGPSQPQVTDEVWDDDRVREFLALEPLGENADFHVLLKAYRGMRATDFVRFLREFTGAGRNLDARDKQGRTLWEIIARHRHSTDFLAARSHYDRVSIPPANETN